MLGKKMVWSLVVCHLSLAVASAQQVTVTVASVDVTIRGLTPGTYTLVIGADGAATIARSGDTPPVNPPVQSDLSSVVRQALQRVPSYPARQRDVDTLGLLYAAASEGLASGGLSHIDAADKLDAAKRTLWVGRETEWAAWQAAVHGTDEAPGKLRLMQRSGEIKSSGDLAAAWSTVSDALGDPLTAQARGDWFAKIVQWFLDDPVQAVALIRNLLELLG